MRKQTHVADDPCTTSNETSTAATAKNALISMSCLLTHPEIKRIREEIGRLPNDSTAMDTVLNLVDVKELRRQGILFPEGTKFELTMSNVEPSGTQADAEIEVCVGGTVKVDPFGLVTVKIPIVCKKLTIPNPFD
jgi:hypothetical protein